MIQKLKCYAQLIRLDKPIGILLLLWPTLTALWIAAQGVPSFRLLVVFTLGVFVMRAAGCVINDIADRHFDGQVARTKERPLVAGRLSLPEAWVLFFVLIAIAFVLALQLNALALLLACIGVVLAAIYPLMKRFTYWPQLILGLAFNWGIPMAFAAQTGHVAGEAWFVYAIAILWTVMYDTMYAMVDREDDLRVGVKSLAILLGDNDRLVLILLQLIILVLLLMLDKLAEFGNGYTLSVVAVACLFFYQQYLIKDQDPARCFKAFLNNQWALLAVFLGVILGYT